MRLVKLDSYIAREVQSTKLLSRNCYEIPLLFYFSGSNGKGMDLSLESYWLCGLHLNAIC